MSRRDGESQRREEIATRRAAMARDAGLQRISSVTRWMIAGVVSLSGGLALLAANAFHGRTIASTSNANTAQTTPGSTTPATTTPATTTPASSGVQAPTPTQAPPVVVSGGS